MSSTGFTIDEFLKAAKKSCKNNADFLAVEVLLSFVMGKDRTYLISHANEVISSMRRKHFSKLFKRLSQGEPISYITGKKEFFGREFLVNRHVLIPRPETELLVETTLKYIEQKNYTTHANLKILDVGTGSGCIAISLAKALPWTTVVGVDISVQALRVAQRNAAYHAVENRVSFLKSNLLANVSGDFDIIVANLPYIGKKRFNFISKNVFSYEPHLALFSGKDGLRLYGELFQQLSERPWKPIAFLGEFGFMQRDELTKLLKKYFPGIKITFSQDYSGIERVFMLEPA